MISKRIIKLIYFIPFISVLLLSIITLFILPTEHPFQSTDIVLNINKSCIPEIYGLFVAYTLYKGATL